MKILIATGGTGGHIFPAIEVSEKRTIARDAFLYGIVRREQ